MIRAAAWYARLPFAASHVASRPDGLHVAEVFTLFYYRHSWSGRCSSLHQFSCGTAGLSSTPPTPAKSSWMPLSPTFFGLSFPFASATATLAARTTRSKTMIVLTTLLLPPSVGKVFVPAVPVRHIAASAEEDDEPTLHCPEFQP